MLRLIVQITDTGDAANIGGPVHTRYRTFDVALPEVEALLKKRDAWVTRNLVGVELLETPAGVTEARHQPDGGDTPMVRQSSNQRDEGE